MSGMTSLEKAYGTNGIGISANSTGVTNGKGQKSNKTADKKVDYEESGCDGDEKHRSAYLAKKERSKFLPSTEKKAEQCIDRCRTALDNKDLIQEKKEAMRKELERLEKEINDFKEESEKIEKRIMDNYKRMEKLKAEFHNFFMELYGRATDHTRKSIHRTLRNN